MSSYSDYQQFTYNQLPNQVNDNSIIQNVTPDGPFAIQINMNNTVDVMRKPSASNPIKTYGTTREKEKAIEIAVTANIGYNMGYLEQAIIIEARDATINLLELEVNRLQDLVRDLSEP